LKSPKHSRETMFEFVQDWTALQRMSVKHGVTLARNASIEKGLKGAPQRDGGDD